MKRTKKIMTLAIAAMLLVSTTVAVTVAYLKSTTDVVENTFTYGKVAITLDEAKVDLYGKEVEGAERVISNEYKLIPNHTYVKDPTVHVAADSEESYIRMIVTIHDLADVKAAFGVATNEYFLPQYFVEGWDNAIWKTTNVVVEDEDANTATYEFRYYQTVSTVGAAAEDLEPLFTKIKVPETVENDALKELEELQIDIVAHAIQADGFMDSADGGVTAEDNAWAAFSN